MVDQTKGQRPIYFDGSFLNNNSGIGRDSRNMLKACRKVFGENLEIIFPSLSMFDKVKVVIFGKVKRIHLPADTILIQTHIFGILPTEPVYRHIVRLHDLFPITNPQWFRFAQRRVFVSTFKALSKNTHFICDSESTEKELKSINQHRKISSEVAYCPVSIPDRESCGSCHVCLGYRPHEYLLTIGTLEPRKNYVLLAKAWIFWKKQRQTDLNLIICGNRGWKFSKILFWFKLGEKNGLIWLPQICDHGVEFLMRESNGFISASQAEGFNLPVAEAVVIGSKIALSDIPVHRELYPNAFIFSIKKIDGLLSAFDYLDDEVSANDLRILPYLARIDILAKSIARITR